jgi:acyl-CoA thioesterase
MTNINNTVANNLTILKTEFKAEPVVSLFNFKLLEISEGFAKVSVILRPEFMNFNGLIFGGIVMALSDQAFAYATNSVIKPNIATQFNIHLINGAKVNDELIAECKVIKSGKRVFVSEISVLDQNGKIIAKATGTTIPKID